MNKRTNRHKFEALAVAACLLCLAVPAVAAERRIEPAITLDDMRVLAACPSQSDVYQGILPEVDWADFKDRDLIILKLTATDAQIIYQNVWGMRRLQFSKKDSERLLRKSDCEDGDRYVLIGKDGGVKRRWSEEVSVSDLFETIDAMPMRQYEMRTRDRN